MPLTSALFGLSAATIRSSRWTPVGTTVCGAFCAWLLLNPAAAADLDGRWRLTIAGHHTFVFGDRILAGGLKIPWETVIEFRVQDETYQLGQGQAHWFPGVSPYSHPPGWFACALSEGTYLDAGLKLHETPWVRYPAFPVAGAVDDETLQLRPALEPPGNYLAVTYRCESDHPAAEDWFTFAARGRNEEGRRQDAITHTEGRQRRADIREVWPLPPLGTLTLPLRDGWYLEVGAPDELDAVSYRLQRLEPEDGGAPAEMPPGAAPR